MMDLEKARAEIDRELDPDLRTTLAVSSCFDQILRHLVDKDEEISALRKEISANRDNIAGHDCTIAVHVGRLNSHFERLNNHIRSINDLNDELAAQGKVLGSHTGRLDAHQSSFVTFVAHRHDITDLRSRLDVKDAELLSIRKRLDALESGVDEDSPSPAVLGAAIDNVESANAPGDAANVGHCRELHHLVCRVRDALGDLRRPGHCHQSLGGLDVDSMFRLIRLIRRSCETSKK